MLRAIILFVVFVTVKSNGCIQRSFGPDAIVCVCNSTYCDTIDNPKLQTGQFQLYTSTKSGERLQLTVRNFETHSQPINGTLLVINSNRKYQKIHGFGGTLSDSAALNIKSLSSATQQNLLKSYFASPGTGIGYTHILLAIAGTDFSTRQYTYDDTPDDVTLSNFSLVEEDNYKIEYLHKIKRIIPDPNSLRILAVSWSAPAWMKTSNTLTWGYLERKYYQTYANYLRKFLDAYKEHDINFWSIISPGHQPAVGTNSDSYYNAMAWWPNASALWSVNYLAPTLSKAGYDSAYIAFDDQLCSVFPYVDDMFSNKKIRKMFSGIAVLGFTDFYSSLTEIHNKYPEKFTLMTEITTGTLREIDGAEHFQEIPGVVLGSWDRGENYALRIIQFFSHWLAGWIDFNLALDINGGPNWNNNNVDSTIIVIPENDEFYKQPMYYATAHFSNFVPRHSRRILSTGFENIENITAIAFLTPDKKIVVVTVNSGDEPVNVIIRDESTNRRINLHLSARSFNTLLYLAHQ